MTERMDEIYELQKTQQALKQEVEDLQEYALQRNKQLETIEFMANGEVDTLINTRIRLFELEEEVKKLREQQEQQKQTLSKRFFRWLFQSDGVSTPKGE
jgi:molybdenum cofactor biosynthesis enzyme MoaA